MCKCFIQSNVIHLYALDQTVKTEVHVKLNAFIVLYRDPDSVVLCVLATDEEDEGDVALQIHFTLIQAFCCDIDINIVRVSGMRRLAQVLGEPLSTDNNANEPRDLHCILVTVSMLLIHILQIHVQYNIWEEAVCSYSFYYR